MNVFKLIVGYAVVVIAGAVVVAALAERKEMESRKADLWERAHGLRKPDYPIESIFVERWSPYALTEKPEISDEELGSLFEATRWAPSSYNAQPWRIIYVKRSSPHWQDMINLLVPFNQSWAQKASVLMLIVGHKYFSHNNEYSPTYAFDCGAAWQNLALQASRMGLVAHGMRGFDVDRARQLYAIPDEYEILAMVALGRPGDASELPTELIQKEQPSLRKSIKEFAFEDTFKP